NNESERTGTIDSDGGCQGAEVDAGAGSGVDGGVLPPEQAHLEAISGRWGRRISASAAGPTRRTAQAARTAGAGSGPLCGRTLRRLWPDADGRTAVEGKAGSGSRDVTALAAGRGQTYGAAAQAKAPAMAGAQAELWCDGATGRVAPRLVRGPQPQVRADGDGG